MTIRYSVAAALIAAALVPQSTSAATLEFPFSEATGCVTKALSWLLKRQCLVLTSESGVFSIIPANTALPEGREVKVKFSTPTGWGASLPDLGCGGTLVGYMSSNQTGKTCKK